LAGIPDVDITTSTFPGSGEMSARCRDFPWDRSPLGEIESWPAALRAVVRSALESPFPINLWCGTELVLIYNDAYRRVLGSKHPGALGRSGREVWAEIWDDIAPLFERIREGGAAAYSEDAPFEVVRAGEREPAWFTFALSPVRDDEGQVVAFLNIVSETTPRILTERELQRARAEAVLAETRLRDIFAHAPAFMAVLRGEDFVFEYANDAYYQLIGHRDVIGQSLFDALPEARGQGYEELLERVLRDGDTIVRREMPLTIVRSPGGQPERRFIDLTYFPQVEPDGSRSGIIAHGMDVTANVLARQEVERVLAQLREANEQLAAQALALAESESRFRAVQDASPDASVLAQAVRDAAGRIHDFLFTYANASTQDVLIGGEENIVGQTMREAFPESVKAGRLETYARVVDTGIPFQQEIFYTRGKVAHGLRVTAVKVGDGVHIGAADLTERLQAEFEREALLQEAEAANRAKSHFLTTMSHELRTPLNAITGYADLLLLGLRGELSTTQREDVERIRRSGQHLLGLINDILNFAKLEAGQVEIRMQEVQLAPLLRGMEDLIRPQLESKGISYRHDVCDDDLTVRADPEKVRQILLNLLANAVKFTGAGGNVSLACEVEEHVVHLHVEDSGVGLAEDQLARVFDPFVQVNRHLTPSSQQGVGLGLSISRDLAIAMDGTLTARSIVDVGSTFTLTLPRVR
jgi:PAS domain S-box-containing protein